MITLTKEVITARIASLKAQKEKFIQSANEEADLIKFKQSKANEEFDRRFRQLEIDANAKSGAIDGAIEILQGLLTMYEAEVDDLTLITNVQQNEKEVVSE